MKIKTVRIRNFYSAQAIDLSLESLAGVVLIEGVT